MTHSHEQSARKAPAPTDAPLDTIPGLGIIRIRALKKAGWASTSALRKASVSDLTAVPGITPNKAQLILDYLGSKRNHHGASADPIMCDRLRRSAGEVVTAACALLNSEQANGFDARFARQLGKLAAFAERLDAITVAAGECPDRVVAQLEKIVTVLNEATSAGHLGVKHQDRLAGELRDRRRKLRKNV